MVLATMPLLAKPMDTYTGLLRRGTLTLRTRIEYAGEFAGQTVNPCWDQQRLNDRLTSGSVCNPESICTPLAGGWGKSPEKGHKGMINFCTSELRVTWVEKNATAGVRQMSPRPIVRVVRLTGHRDGTDSLIPAKVIVCHDREMLGVGPSARAKARGEAVMVLMTCWASGPAEATTAPSNGE